jgi:hypothetical protein
MVLAHGGATNAAGCHTNSKTGSYHCHPVSSATSTARAIKAAPTIKQARAADQRSSSDSRHICYIGPKGGTYIIGASGKKQYQPC